MNKIVSMDKLVKIILFGLAARILGSSCSTSDYAAVVGGYGHEVE